MWVYFTVQIPYLPNDTIIILTADMWVYFTVQIPYLPSDTIIILTADMWGLLHRTDTISSK